MEHKTFWDKSAATYDHMNKSFAAAYKKTIECTIKYLNPTMSILDFGCGTGIVTNALAEKVRFIKAIDISPKMLEEAKRKASNLHIENVVYEIGTIEDIRKKGEKFDCIVAYNMLHFIKNIDSFLVTLHDLLIPKGLFISATDCMAGTISLKGIVVRVLVALRLLPLVKFYSVSSLKSTIETNGYSIIEEQSLFDNPPNYFIAARRQ